MNTATDLQELHMLPRSLFTLPDAAGVEIACRDGSVWITLDHDVRDIVLEAGQSFVASDHRRALIYALGSARVELRSETTEASAVALKPLLASRAYVAPAALRA